MLTIRTIEEVINQRRRQMLVHSFLYYILDRPIVDDQTFDGWARELYKLQTAHPELAKKCMHARAFKNFDGSTGFHLPVDSWVKEKGFQLLNYHNSRQT